MLGVLIGLLKIINTFAQDMMTVMYHLSASIAVLLAVKVIQPVGNSVKDVGDE